MWGFQWLLDFVNGFWEVFLGNVLWLVDGLSYLMQSVLYLIIDGLLTVLVTVISAIDCSAMAATMAANYDLLPSALVYVINAICLPQGLSIIVSGILIRMTINLIPAEFTRV